MNEKLNNIETSSQYISGWLQVSDEDTVPKPAKISIEPTPKNFNEFWERYKKFLRDSNQLNYLKPTSSAIVRFLAPSLGGLSIKGKRASEKEIEASFEFLKKIPVSVLGENAVKTCLENIDRQPRCNISKMINWAKEKGWILPDEENKPEYLYRFRQVGDARPSDRLDISEKKYTDKTNGKTVMLGLFEEDFFILPNPSFSELSLPPLSWLPRKTGVFLVWIQLIEVLPKYYLGSVRLEQELTDLKKFFLNFLNLQPVTAKNYYENLLRFLGWLHRVKKVPLADLSIASLVPFVKLKFNLSNCLDSSNNPNFQEKIFKEALAKEKAKELAKEKADLLEEYCSDSRMYPGTVMRQFTTAINIAKFVYHKETEEFKLNGGFEDIPFVKEFSNKRLIYERQIRQPGGKVKTLIAQSEKIIPWNDVLKAVDKARVEATLEWKYYKRHRSKNKSEKVKIDRTKRKPEGIAGSFQSFMILALMTAIPPRRPRVYYELEMGRTFLYGNWVDGKFVAAKKMKNPQDASYWLHLQPDDYKTGKTYGEYWGKIPNIIYSDGVSLYSYIDQWLTKWRPLFAKSHNYFFTQNNDRPFNSSSWGKRFARTIYHFTNEKMNPHSMRHSLVTYLKDQGTPHETMQALAYAMAHSEETQAKIYNQQEQKNKSLLP